MSDLISAFLPYIVSGICAIALVFVAINFLKGFNPFDMVGNLVKSITGIIPGIPTGIPGVPGVGGFPSGITDSIPTPGIPFSASNKQDQNKKV